jgi:hypothetical protein
LIELDKEYPTESYATIYLFGYNEAIQKFEGYAYRKENNYVSEKINYGIGLRPPLDNDVLDKLANDEEDRINPYKGFIEIMKAQKKGKATEAPSEKIHIGGDIHLFSMTKDSYSYQKIYRFEDYDAMYRYMTDKINENKKANVKLE